MFTVASNYVDDGPVTGIVIGVEEWLMLSWLVITCLSAADRSKCSLSFEDYICVSPLHQSYKIVCESLEVTGDIIGCEVEEAVYYQVPKE